MIFWYLLHLPTAKAQMREGSGSVVDCLTRDKGVADSSLTSVTALYP